MIMGLDRILTSMIFTQTGKNIIIHNNALSGVIDWECTQYGEFDFDLIHLLHWSLFPPTKAVDMRNLFDILFQYQMKRVSVTMIEKRLTIYLLEHDFIQILWSSGIRADEYLSRIKWWVSGGLEIASLIPNHIVNVKNKYIIRGGDFT